MIRCPCNQIDNCPIASWDRPFTLKCLRRRIVLPLPKARVAHSHKPTRQFQRSRRLTIYRHSLCHPHKVRAPCHSLDTLPHPPHLHSLCQRQPMDRSHPWWTSVVYRFSTQGVQSFRYMRLGMSSCLIAASTSPNAATMEFPIPMGEPITL
jgi:hypothetical protein